MEWYAMEDGSSEDSNQRSLTVKTTGWILMTNFERGYPAQLSELHGKELGCTGSTAWIMYDLHFSCCRASTARETSNS